MTRAATPGADFEYRSFGAPGAERTVFVLREGPAATVDPDPSATAQRDVRIVAVGVTADDIDDPAAYRGATPAAVAAAAIAHLVTEEALDRPVGLVGVGAASELALMVAARLGNQVDRLALVAVPEPDTELDRDEVEELLSGVEAKTLIVNATQDPDATAAAARWHQERLPSARVEIVSGVSDADPRVSLADQWDSVLSHVAPDASR